MKKLILVPATAFCIVLGARFLEPQPAGEAAASAPTCVPSCDACHFCFQLVTPPGQLRPPPFCAPKNPKPLGCP